MTCDLFQGDDVLKHLLQIVLQMRSYVEEQLDFWHLTIQ